MLICIQVRATDDGGLYTEEPFTIRILDENDYIPLFKDHFMEIMLDEDVRIGQSVGRMTATDLDAEGPNNRIYYYIDNSMQGSFRMDLWTGKLTSIVSCL